MGLFSKLFSRENEPADKAQDGSEPDAGSPEKEQDAQSETSAAAQSDRNERPARAPVAKAEPPPLPSPEALEEQPTTRFVAESTKEGVALREAPVVDVKAAVAGAAPQPATPPPLAEPPKREPAPPKMAPILKSPKTKAETPKKVEPAKAGAAAAPRPAPAPAPKAAPPPRGASDEAARPKRAPKDTLPAFRAPAVPIAPEAPSAQNAPQAVLAQAEGAQPLAAEVEAAVDSLLDMSASSPKSSASDEAADQRAVAETFAAVVKVNAHPLRDFMFQLSVGRTPRQWAAACRPVIHPLLEASKQIGAAELTGALLAFDAALARASSEASACIGDASVAALEQAYACMHGQMPEAFAPVAQADGRRLVLLESLLLQVPALHRRTLDKLYAVGLTSLPQLSLAKPEELAAVAGLDLELAQAVVEHIRRFELERSRVDPTALRSHAHERLRAVVRRLEQLQAEFERAEQEESSVRKRAARRGREAAVLELEVLLAELGDLDLLEELKRCPVRTKIRRVESYLERPPASA